MEHYFVNGLAGFGGVGAVYLVARMVMFLNDLRKAAQERKEASVMSGVLQAQERNLDQECRGLAIWGPGDWRQPDCRHG